MIWDGMLCSLWEPDLNFRTIPEGPEMLILVLGGAASGKSEYAEKLAVQAGSEAQSGRMIYLATMRHGSTAEARISKHVKQREGLGFETLEDPLFDKEWPEAQVILLEDIPNLLANRMFSAEGNSSAGNGDISDTRDSLPLQLTEEVLKLRQRTEELIIVSGDIFRDGTEYSEITERYMALLGELNCRLAEKADRVVEVVCGIPVDIKVHR